MVREFLQYLSPPPLTGRAAASNAAGLALAAATAAIALTIAAVSQELTGVAVFSILVLPIILAAWFGGPRWGAIFMLAICAIAMYAILPPRWSLQLEGAGVIRIIFLAVTSAVIIFLVERLRVETAHAEELAAARDDLIDDLTRANEAKLEFVRHVSHELRTPMTTVKGNAIILRDRWASLHEDDRAESLADVVDAVERLQTITDNLLALARLDAAQDIEREPVIVEQIVRDVLERHRKAYPRREYELISNAERRPVLCSPGLMGQVIENLVSNAEKYGGGGAITIIIDRSDSEVSVTVSDRGKGIAAELVETLFAPFTRATDVGSIPGLGIGLSVCKRIAEAEGGSISASRREGGGSHFTLTLPRAMNPERYEPMPPVAPSPGARARGARYS